MAVMSPSVRLKPSRCPLLAKRAREISEHCVYGSMELLDIEMEA